VDPAFIELTMFLESIRDILPVDLKRCDIMDKILNDQRQRAEAKIMDDTRWFGLMKSFAYEPNEKTFIELKRHYDQKKSALS